MARRIRAVVVDDEPLARRTVASLLRRDADVELVAECSSGAEAVAAIERTKPDLVLLDIQMPECDGFDVLDRLGAHLTAEVVFVTAYDQHAVHAFEAGALDYILKPFTDERFDVTLRRVKSRIAVRDAIPGKQRLFVKGNRQFSVVAIREIHWIEAADYYACLHVGPRTHLIRQSITRLEQELDSRVFCRIHRSTIVNVDRVLRLDANDAGEYEVLLADGTRLKLSRRYRRRLHAQLQRTSDVNDS